jgi:hypothetical protein
MPVSHKFLNHNWENGFWTENAILKTDRYNPEVLFLGTFNHGFDWNTSDFFYGRDMYMWTIMSNLFINNENHLTSRRTIINNIPTLTEVFIICQKGKFVFADLIKGTSNNAETNFNVAKKCVIVQDSVNHYCWNNYKDNSILDLIDLGFIDDNVKEIINYIKKTPSIKYIYCTFKSGNQFIQMLNIISNSIRQDVKIEHIFTPTGNGFGQNLPQPYGERAWSLSHCWVWNDLNHEVNVNKVGYGNLNHNWLNACGVDVENF